MGGDHSHHGHQHGSTGNLKTAFLLNLAFTVIEIIGGFWTNSIAILSDAVHDLGDSLSLGLAWYFDRISKKGATPHNTYGYRRYSLLGGLITAIVLLVGLAFVLWQALARLFSPEPVNAPGMVLLAVVGVAFNGAAVLKVRRGSSLTERVVSWHLLEDTLGWLAVLIGAAIMTFWDLPIVDPILSIGISLFVLWNVVRNLRQFFDVFLQKTPRTFDAQQFERCVLAMPKVASMHHTHSWSIDGETHVLTTHLVMKADASRDDVVEAKNRVRSLLDREAFVHVTVDVELEGEECLASEEHSHAGSEFHAHTHNH
ncbi:cation diffusion facilitator family transporter [Azohydromonas caseinilytica]|uniref:Cation transporter n=1 Tax=Azohydromonas caseinilytica TaxID=2728836 RepID=A0A848FG24_9BURK|nr:cation diffusion facilitator family transporter [Azohydromonas caseinilytica]NML17080.1 cation transporter [Azohydromonas caseinilytica]